MEYGKLVDGKLVPAPNPLRVSNGYVYNPSGYLYAAVGYKMIVDTPIPKRRVGQKGLYVAHWEEKEDRIIKVWTAAEPTGRISGVPGMFVRRKDVPL